MVEKLYREGDKFKIKIPSINNHIYDCTLTQIKANEFMLISADGNRYNDLSVIGRSTCHGVTLDQVNRIVTESQNDAIIIEINGKKVEEIFSLQVGDVIKISCGTTFDKVMISYDGNYYRLVVLESNTYSSSSKRGSILMVCGIKEWRNLETLNDKLDYVSGKMKVCKITKVSV